MQPKHRCGTQASKIIGRIPKAEKDKCEREAMKMKKQKRIIALAVMLCLMIACLGILTANAGKTNVTLNVSLYREIPDYDSFEEMVRACWAEKHPEVELNFVEWDCYGTEVPDDLDVFVFDTVNLDTFVEKGYLLVLSEEDIRDYEDLIPSMIEGCRINGSLCAVPQFLCTDLLYTRKGDLPMQDVQSVDDLHTVLGDSGLLMDEDSDGVKVCLYLQALIDERQHYMESYPPVEEGKLSQGAINSLAKLRDMRQTDPEGVTEDSGWYPYAGRFAEGLGRAYIGYSEAMDVMGESAAEMDFRLFSMTGGEDIPVFYMDAAAINAGISDEKKALALELLNMITGSDLLVRASDRSGNPRYLLSERSSVYDVLGSKYPVYTALITITTVPEAYVFRIRPDGAAYLEEARRNAEILPSIFG